MFWLFDSKHTRVLSKWGPISISDLLEILSISGDIAWAWKVLWYQKLSYDIHLRLYSLVESCCRTFKANTTWSWDNIFFYNMNIEFWRDSLCGSRNLKMNFLNHLNDASIWYTSTAWFLTILIDALLLGSTADLTYGHHKLIMHWQYKIQRLQLGRHTKSNYF